MSDVIDYRKKVEDAINVEGNAMSGGAWAKEYARGIAPLAWAVVGLTEELKAGTDNISDALDAGDLGRELGSAIERGMDSAAQDISNAIERGFSEVARAISGLDIGG